MLYLNTGTKGLTALPVIDALSELTRRVEVGGYPAYLEVQAEASQARRRLAQMLGADEDEIAFTGNASHSLNIAAQGLRWDALRPAPGRPVDVLISDHEYPTTNVLFNYLAQTGRARLIRYTLSHDKDRTLASLERHVTDETRLVVASHVDCNTGLRADVRAISAWCRERGIISFIDGAQAVGQFPIDLHDIGCDLYISNGHKWLFGPNGVGLLYVRRGFEEHLEPQMVGLGTATFGKLPVEWRPGAARYELLATQPAPVFAAMNAALDWLESFGPDALENRQRELTEWVKARILARPDRFRLLTPLAWEDSSALASIQVPGVTGRDWEAFVLRMLTERTGFFRAVPEFDALRLSMAYYNTEEEYERFFRLLEKAPTVPV